MKIDNIQSYNTAFNAKLKVLGKFFFMDELDVLAKKAKKIGFENDIVELNFTNYKDGSIEFLNSENSDVVQKISGMLKARFVPNGEGAGTELYKEMMAADSYKDFWNKENCYANKYLDRLSEKYHNDFIGVSIIEN